MARRPRLVVPGTTFHVTQRGANKVAIFVDDDDRDRFLRLLHRACLDTGVALHAYALMDNHVHLLLTPGSSDGLAKAMRRQGTSYVQSFNLRHARSGPLWQGRFHSSMVDSQPYLLEVVRYIELNPVRAGMVADAAYYPWSSARGNMGLWADPLLTPHPAMLDAGAHARFLADSADGPMLDAIREKIRRQQPLGNLRYQQWIEEAIGRPTVPKRGRPRRIKKGDGGS